MQILLIKKKKSQRPIESSPSSRGRRDAQERTEISAAPDSQSWSGQCPRQAQDCCSRAEWRGGLGQGPEEEAGGAFSDLLS